MTINVLWVEEEPQSVKYERKVAEEQEGWVITTIDNVSEAMKLIESTTFDLVIVDLILPLDNFHKQRGYVTPESGIQLIESIRNPDRKGCTRPDVLLLVASCVISPEQKARVINSLRSSRHYLTKPLQEDTCRSIFSELTSILTANVHN